MDQLCKKCVGNTDKNHNSEVFEDKLQFLWKKNSSLGRKYSRAPPKTIILIQNRRSKHLNSAIYLPYSNQKGRLSNGSDIPAMNDPLVSINATLTPSCRSLSKSCFYPMYVPRLTVPVFSEILRYYRWLY